MAFKILTPQEAASFVNDGDNVGLSGFTAAGSPKVVTGAVAERAMQLHGEGKPFKINVFTGASNSDLADGVLARANAINFRAPYQSNGDMRNAINMNALHYADMHLSHLSQELRYGFYGKMNIAIIEACKITPEGEVTLTTGVGLSHVAAIMAEKVIIELNSYPPDLTGFHDVYVPNDPSERREIPIYKPNDKAGSPVLKIDPSKIVGVVESNKPDGVKPFAPVDEVTAKIGENVANFLAEELKAGRIPKSFLPIQSGVGNIANAVLGCLGSNKDIPAIEMYTEVIQDAVISLMKEGRCTFASGCSLTLSDEVAADIYKDLDAYKGKLLLRPIEISNHPELIRRMGLITINTALEADIYGNVNSTHVLGTKMMNGIGGSGDFTRNAYISIFTCPSVAKGGKISAIVPMVSHHDHTEHDVKILITEQGVADLRGKSPRQRAEAIIDNCVHPMYREKLRAYLASCGTAHTAHNLKKVFEMHDAFIATGDMMNAEF